MDEAIKNKVILVLAILSAIFFVGTIGSCSSAYRQKTSRDKEMAKRLDYEERLTKVMQERESAQAKLKLQTQELEEEKALHQEDKKALLQEQLINQNIKEELNKVTKLKEALEEDLKDALVKNKDKSRKMR